MNIEIVSARESEPVVHKLFALYIHDLSEIVGVDVQDDGAFAMPGSYPGWWDGSDSRHPFLFRADGKLAGFALVRRLSAESVTHDMGEFFVLRKYRRAGVGREVAYALFDRFPGAWEVRELPSNVPAQGFWRRIIADYTGSDFDERREYFEAYKREFVVQRFRSR